MTDLKSAIDHLINEKRFEFKGRRNVKIISNLETTVSTNSRIQANELNLLISNLINNSIEAIESDGTISVSLTNSNNKNIIKIADDGKGISIDDLKKIGKKNVSIGKKNGSGLGLFNARKSIERFGGTLTVYSEYQKGTEIEIKLPSI